MAEWSRDRDVAGLNLCLSHRILLPLDTGGFSAVIITDIPRY